MKFIFFIAAFNALFFAVFLIQKKPRALHDNILIFWLIYLGLYTGVYAFYSHDLFVNFHLLSVSLLSLLMLFGPLLYHYILTLVTNKKRLTAKDFMHLLPFLFFNLYIWVASGRPQLSAKLDMEKISPGFAPPFLFAFFLVLTAFSGTFYLLLTLRLFRRLDIKIFNNYSNSADVDLFWIRKVILVFGIVWTSLVAITIIHHLFGMFSIAFCTDGLFLALSAFIIVIGYFGLKQKIIYPDEAVILADNSKIRNKYSGSGISQSETEKMAAQVKKHMESAKPYLNPDLTLAQLASETGISSHVLSRVINEQFSLNFFDFINHYRVKEFREKIQDPKYSHFSVLGIALESGFNSKSAFNRVFKKITGQTPSSLKRPS